MTTQDDEPDLFHLAHHGTDTDWHNATGHCGGCGAEGCHEGPCEGEYCRHCPERAAQGLTTNNTHQEGSTP